MVSGRADGIGGCGGFSIWVRGRGFFRLVFVIRKVGFRASVIFEAFVG